MSLINYHGESKVTKRICELLNVTDVQVNGVSVVDENGIADVSGGGGSTVVWNQIQATGTKIAEITINGTETDVYAPNGGGSAEALDDLTDVTITTPTEGQVLNYDDDSDLWINKTIIRELTQAQYDTLPDSKLTDGVTYYITDGAPSNATIDGVFIDASSVVYQETINSGSISVSSYEYTATQDCIVKWILCTPSSNQITKVLINTAEIFRIQNTPADELFANSFPVKKGQIIKFDNIGAYAYITVYGVQGGSEEIPYIEVSGTLTAGSTSITLLNDLITTNSTIEPFTSVYGVNPTDISLSTGSVTLTFEAQASDLSVKVRVS